MASDSIVTVSLLARNNDKIKEELNKKVNKSQGTENKGKLLGIDDEGNVGLLNAPDKINISSAEGNSIEQKPDGIYAPTTDVSNFVEKEPGKGLFSGAYEDLTGQPEIPSIDGLVSENDLNTILSEYTKTENLPEEYDDTALSNRVTNTETAIATLNGNGDGSVSKTVDNALNDFATKISNDGVVNTYKELVDYAAEHSGEIAEIAGDISKNTSDISALDTRVSTVETNLGGHTVKKDVPSDAKFTDTTYSEFVKSGSGAKSGLVPSPSTTAGTTKFLREDGTWVKPTDTKALTSMTGILPTTKGGTGNNYSEFYELIEDILYNADGIVNTVGIGNKKQRQSGSKSQFAFWKTNNNTRIECVASTSGNYIVDAITIYTTLTGGSAFPSLVIDYNVTPGLDNEGDLGGPQKRWCNIYSATGTISTSDRNKKKDIVSLDADKTLDFIMGLNPVSYKFIDGESGRTHHGLISQEVEELLERLGMSSYDFAGFIKSPKTTEDGTVIEGEYNYALRDTEFIADLIKVVQIQQKQIEKQEERISRLESMNGIN